MNNVAGNSDYSETLAKYQKFYDQYHETWVKECVDMEAYTRMGKIFDRHLPWEQKKYQVNGSKGKSTKKWPDFLESYKELTGKEYKMKP